MFHANISRYETDSLDGSLYQLLPVIGWHEASGIRERGNLRQLSGNDRANGVTVGETGHGRIPRHLGHGNVWASNWIRDHAGELETGTRFDSRHRG